MRTDGAAVVCPKCAAVFGGMAVCPFDGTTLTPLPDADPTAVAFYGLMSEPRSTGLRTSEPSSVAATPGSLNSVSPPVPKEQP